MGPSANDELLASWARSLHDKAPGTRRHKSAVAARMERAVPVIVVPPILVTPIGVDLTRVEGSPLSHAAPA